ncbi:MAG: DUF4065 domain-containing protein [Labilithrix sp.]|nr:DUF4065 domain-containing protein [Labilithrix sp.]MCW5809953.1 DUF4065 domain-containing protein [Labilithrix sp.]
MTSFSLPTSTDHAALTLADWICATAPSQPDLLTHLKLQKLAFYCYGALLAFGLERELGTIEFQAWKHGPVSPAMYRKFQPCGREPILFQVHKPSLDVQVEAVASDVVNVYGRLTAWQLREESHLENPWTSAYDDTSRNVIPAEQMREHFHAKFCLGVVQFPERLFGGSSLRLDRIPVPTFRSLREMSIAATRILGPA